ncbi:hypothetical protein F0562_021629 [Nyssa sinensis]|uniref:Uncharacterized protein n=1 Tax=Nyssa sinensis TaxID=561372 RepID=A0A5J5BKF2_9ASTE|nr:hypothetical protein F0562_021629 [Nyssa sinensis]
MRLACGFWKLHSVFLQMCLWSPLFRAQSPELSARALDSLLQDYAFRAFLPPKTGIPYNGRVPSNLTGIKVSALRLRSGSLRKRGFSSFKEFHIPIGVVEQPYVERLVLVYHNLQNWSSLYYPLPGFTYLAPVLGLLAYDASNLSASDLSELDIRASQNPILITFFNASSGLSPKCVYFGLDGLAGRIGNAGCVGETVQTQEKDTDNATDSRKRHYITDDNYWEFKGTDGIGDSDKTIVGE